MRIILTRHGKTIENEQGIFQGHLHGKLTKEGIEQAKQLAKALKNEPIDHIFSSDLARASDTAKEIAKYHKNIPFNLTEKLRERYLGELQGKKKIDLGLDPKELVAGTVESKTGEPQKQMYERANSLIKELIKNFQNKNILLVGHYGINKAIITNILNKTFEEYEDVKSQDNCAISIFNLKDTPTIEVWNSIAHLQ